MSPGDEAGALAGAGRTPERAARRLRGRTDDEPRRQERGT